jgi:hypothetical protein
VEFKGLGKFAAPLASGDIKKRWETSLKALKAPRSKGRHRGASYAARA